MKPNATHYLSTYPAAVKLWLEGKHQEAAHSFVANQAQLILKGDEQKALHYAHDRQQSESERAPAKIYEAQTDALCKAAWAMCKAWPLGGPLLEDNEAYMALVRQINFRRDKYQELYGVYREQTKARTAAIRLKAFIRIMRLMDKKA